MIHKNTRQKVNNILWSVESKDEMVVGMSSMWKIFVHGKSFRLRIRPILHQLTSF